MTAADRIDNFLGLIGLRNGPCIPIELRVRKSE